MTEYSVDNRNNWKTLYPTYVDRWHDKYSTHTDKRENRRPIWNGTCIDCQSATEKGKGWRNCDSCFAKYYALRYKYVSKARNLTKLKTNKHCEITGCNKTDFCDYIEKQFHSGMTWDNYATVWQIDHIIPSAWFDFNDVDEIKICCNYSNLQPLLVKDNYDKNATIV
jgi:hypothetical protein